MQEISSLFKRYLNNECTKEEIQSLLKHFSEEEHTNHLKLLIEKQLMVEADADFENRPEVQSIFSLTDQFLEQELFVKRKSLFSKISPYSRYAAAASIIGIFIATIYLLNQGRPEQLSRQQSTLNDALPGKDKAILTLADGSAVALETGADATILNDHGLKISKTKEGLLIYETVNKNVKSNVLQYNELHTPNGAKYELRLPDGTKVWLNASSTLKFPIAFAADERKVELKGEAYFEVEKLTKAQKRIPFFVETSNQTIQVLGTEFNVCAYPDEDFTKTTLISGKVNVRNTHNQEHMILDPGYQAISISDDHMQLVRANVENAIAWKNGNFMYEDVLLKDILKKLSRWYNVEVDYRDVPETRYNIFISRKETLKNVLNMLEKTGNIKFQISDNTIKILN